MMVILMIIIVQVIIMIIIMKINQKMVLGMTMMMEIRIIVITIRITKMEENNKMIMIGMQIINQNMESFEKIIDLQALFIYIKSFI